jgi:hypothetical protein
VAVRVAALRRARAARRRLLVVLAVCVVATLGAAARVAGEQQLAEARCLALL